MTALKSGLKNFDIEFMFGLVENYIQDSIDSSDELQDCIHDHIEVVNRYYRQREHGLTVKDFDILAMKHYVGLLDSFYEK